MIFDHPKNLMNFFHTLHKPQEESMYSPVLVEYMTPDNSCALVQNSIPQLISGKWKQQEQKLYGIFLQDKIDLFGDKTTRKSRKVFLQMSRFIKTRTAQQCRTHHQKMLKSHGSLQSILRFLNHDISSSGHTISDKKIESDMNKMMTNQTPSDFFSILKVSPNRIKIVIQERCILEF